MNQPESPTTNSKDDLPVLAFAGKQDFESWLSDHHASTPGCWLKIAKKGAGISSVSYAEALDVALCYGWIDGQKNTADQGYWLQRFTPRGPRSKWSKINRSKAETLIERGEMKPAGLREIDRAKADGRWEAAYESQSAATVPEDLRLALAANDGARAFFDTLDSANRYAILYRLQDARNPETRARRLQKFVNMLSEQKKIHP